MVPSSLVPLYPLAQVFLATNNELMLMCVNSILKLSSITHYLVLVMTIHLRYYLMYIIAIYTAA